MFEIADLVIKKCPSHKKKDQEKYVIFYGPRRPRLLNFQDQTIQQHPRRFWASHGPTPWPMFIFFDWKAHVYSLPTFLAVCLRSPSKKRKKQCVSASFPGETNSRCPTYRRTAASLPPDTCAVARKTIRAPTRVRWSLPLLFFPSPCRVWSWTFLDSLVYR